jgi:predicted amidophosphoribosyltransferase
VRCAHCDWTLSEAARFCRRCGSPAGAPDPRCPRCAEPAQEGQRFCRHCGAELARTTDDVETREVPVADVEVRAPDPVEATRPCAICAAPAVPGRDVCEDCARPLGSTAETRDLDERLVHDESTIELTAPTEPLDDGRLGLFRRRT